ncbi:MAG: TonB-dependent receptor plug domain-containing protein [Methylococcaceae bacterium]|nr:TonB-dependent receptor plug domain-containing protein [Methylococcaceae bacterium]
MKDHWPELALRVAAAITLAQGLLLPLPMAIADEAADFKARDVSSEQSETIANTPNAATESSRARAAAADKTKDVADMDIAELVNVKVSPFEVSSQLDSGYHASNSVSGSRLDAPIRDLPLAIQAFTESFIEDQKPRDIFDVARYSPGVTYRSNDFNEGNANLAIRGFAVGSIGGGVNFVYDQTLPPDTPESAHQTYALLDEPYRPSQTGRVS